MSLTYQQQFVLAGLAGRAAILDLDARYNRLYSAGDLAGWIATFRHAGASLTRAGETFTDLPAAFDGGNGQRLATVDHEISVDGVGRRNDVSCCCSAKANCRPPALIGTASSTSVAAGTSRRANSSGISSHARG